VLELAALALTLAILSLEPARGLQVGLYWSGLLVIYWRRRR
jgi:hypothetical protein